MTPWGAQPHHAGVATGGGEQGEHLGVFAYRVVTRGAVYGEALIVRPEVREADSLTRYFLTAD